MHTFTSRDGLRLAYYDDCFAPPWQAAEAILLLHPAMGNSQRWFHWMPALTARYRVVRLDLRGHGGSQAPTAADDFSLQHLVDDACELLDRLGIDRAHVVGNSAGGYVSQKLAIQHPERVRTLAGSKDAELQSVRPLLYQGGSDMLSSATDPILVTDDGLAVDFEAEIAVITGPVLMAAHREEAAAAIRLITICNDVSLRRLVADDLQNGFGFFHSKPSTAFGPVVATPDEFGSAWQDNKLHLKLRSQVNDTPFGQPDAGVDMHFDFADLIVAATQTRRLGPGTIIGSGTVTNRHDDAPPMRRDGIGFSCIAEARAVEKLKYGKARTPFLKEGDRISISLLDAAGTPVIGTIEQKVVRYSR